MTQLVDIDTIDPDHLAEIAFLLRERRRREAEGRTALLAELLDKPTIGHYRRLAQGQANP